METASSYEAVAAAAEGAVVEQSAALERKNDPSGRSEARPAPRLEIVRPVAPARPRGSDVRQLLLAVIAGLALALTMVALAVMFRPAPGQVEAPAVVQAPAPEPVIAEATPVGEATVRLRFGPGLPEAERAALRESALAAGFAAVDLGPLPFPVDRARVEYFRAADRAAAQTLAAALEPLAGAMDLRDLSATEGAGEPGRIDAWLVN